jgi:hypothetical protein
MFGNDVDGDSHNPRFVSIYARDSCNLDKLDLQQLRPLETLYNNLSRHPIWVCEWSTPTQDLVKMLPISHRWLSKIIVREYTHHLARGPTEPVVAVVKSAILSCYCTK